MVLEKLVGYHILINVSKKYEGLYKINILINLPKK